MALPTVPSLPAQGNTSWFAWASGLHSFVQAVPAEVATKTTTAAVASQITAALAGYLTSASLAGYATTAALAAKADASALSNYLTTAAAASSYAPLAETVNTANSGTAITLPAPGTATLHNITLTGNATFTFPTAVAGASFTVRLLQDATGGRTVTWPASVKWSGGAAPVLSSTAGKQDVLSFTSIDGSTWLGFVAGLDMR